MTIFLRNTNASQQLPTSIDHWIDRLYRPDFGFVPLVILLLGFILMMPMRTNHDVAFYLYGGDLLLHGKLLYIDWKDINPPLIFYLSAIPTLISAIFPIHVIFAFSLLVFALVVWSALSMRRQLVHSGLELTQTEIGVVLVCWVLYSLYCYQENDFGQRDHLFVLLFVPYFVFRWIRWENGYGRLATAIATGVAAGIGSCLKPYFLVVPLMCEAYWLVKYRRWGRIFQPEIAVFVLTGLAYAAHFFFLPEIVRRELVDHLIPQILNYYPKFTSPRSFVHVVNRNMLFAALALAAFPFLATPIRRSNLWGLARASSVIVAGGVVIYLLHFKGFSYHFLVMLAGTSLITGIALAESRLFRLRDSPPGQERFALVLSKRQVFVTVVLLTLFSVSAFGLRALFKTAARFADTPFTQIISQYSQKGDYVLVIAADHGVIWPSLLQMERKQASRFGTFAIFPLVYGGTQSNSKGGNFAYHSESNAPEEEIRALRELEEDIRKFKPKLIVVHDPLQCQTCPKGFRMLDYLDKMRVLTGPMKDYRHVATLGEFWAYVPESRGH